MRIPGNLIAACVFCISTAAQVPAFDPSRVLQEAMLLAKVGEIARARQLAEEVSTSGSSRADVQNELGRVYENLGDIQKAQEAYLRAVELDPHVEDYYLDAVSLLFLQEQPRKAIDLLNSGLQKIPDSYSLTVALGTANQASDQKPAALGIFEQAIKMRPDVAKAYVLYGKLATSLGQTDAAIRALLKAVEIDAGDARGRYYLGSAYLAAGQPDSKPLAEFQKALEIDPHYAPARYELAKGLERQNHFREAVDEYSRALKDDPSLIQIYYRLYRSYTRLGQKEKAQEALKTFRSQQKNKRAVTLVSPPREP